MNKSKKRVLLALICIIGGILILSINAIIYFLNHSERGEDGNNTRASFNVELDNIWDLGKLKNMGKEPTEEELGPYYRSSIGEALKYSNLHFEKDEQYMRNIDVVIKQIENNNYVLLFYLSIKDDDLISTNICKFKVKEENGIRQYVVTNLNPVKSERNSKMIGTHKNVVEGMIGFIDFVQKYSFDPNKKILWGYSETENIYSLKIEGQPPTEIVPYEEFGNTCYLWYYLDLQTNGKQPSEMVVEMDE